MRQRTYFPRAEGRCQRLSAQAFRAGRSADAIRNARDGGAPMSSQIAYRVVRSFHEPGAEGLDTTVLTEREKRDSTFLSKGFRQQGTRGQIANQRANGAHASAAHLRKTSCPFPFRSDCEILEIIHASANFAASSTHRNLGGLDWLDFGA